MKLLSPLPFILALCAAPLLFGVINRVKAFFAGRRGQPLLQPYYDLARLFGKGGTYSRTTTWVFRAGPVVGVACGLLAAALVPMGGVPALLAFPGDLVLFAYALGLMRFVTVIAALDTGSSFEGMGASREVHFSALAEPALFLALAVLARLTKSASLSDMLGGVTVEMWRTHAHIIVLVAVALLAVVLAENARIPVDDPNTHLELTMIHEVMVLDHSGPDFGMILYGSALKLWVMGSILVQLVVPVRTPSGGLDAAVLAVGLLALAAAVGTIESSMARLRLLRVPHLLMGAGALSVLALILVMR